MILLLRLNDGTELIADVSEEEETSYLCSDVLQVVKEYSSNKQTVNLVPFMPYADTSGGVVIPLNMAIVMVPGEKLKEYHSKVFSKIIMPDSKIVLA